MKIADKLQRVNGSLTVRRYDNGFLVEVDGHDSNDDWANVELIANPLEEVIELLKEFASMKRN